MDIKKKLIVTAILIVLLFCLMLSAGWFMNGLGYGEFNLPMGLNVLQGIKGVLEFLVGVGGL